MTSLHLATIPRAVASAQSDGPLSIRRRNRAKRAGVMHPNERARPVTLETAGRDRHLFDAVMCVCMSKILPAEA